VFLWRIDPWIPEACFYDQRANCAAVWDIVTKRGILACCNAAHTPLATPINSTQATDARSRIRRKSGKAGGVELQLFAPAAICCQNAADRRPPAAAWRSYFAVALSARAVSAQKPPILVFHKVKYRPD
jgi:hypothetical protein